MIGGAADEHAQDVRRRRKIVAAGPVADALDRHRRDRTERGGVRRHDQRAGRRHELLLDRTAVNRRVAQQLHRRGCWYRKMPVCTVHHAAADVERGRDDPVGAKPLEREHRADDVDDRVEGADLVKMHFLDRHVVNRGFDVREPLKQRLRSIAARRRQRRLVDQLEDARQMPVRMCARAPLP